MHFDAIVHAPSLRAGTRLNIAGANQSEGDAPDRLAVGAEVWLRFGVCCPDLSRGTIIEHTQSPESVVLGIGADTWVLRKGEGGVQVPGLLSEDWFVDGLPVARP